MKTFLIVKFLNSKSELCFFKEETKNILTCIIREEEEIISTTTRIISKII